MSFQDKLKPVQQSTPATGSFQQKLKPMSVTPKPTFFVPTDPAKASQQRLQDAQNDQVQYDQEANKGFLGRFGKALVKNLAPSEVGLGKTISGILYQGSKTDQGLQESIATGEQTKVDLLKAIRENEAKGIDATRLKEAYNNQQKVGEKTTKTARDLVQLPTTGQAVGQIGGTALDVLTAGTYSKAKTAGMGFGKLSMGTPAVKTLATAAGAPELGAIAGQKAAGLFSLRGAGNIAKGATTGYASDVALGLQGERGEERTGAKAFIPGLGTALGAGIPAVSEATQTVRNIANPEPRIVEKRMSGLLDLEKKNGKVAKVFGAADRRGIDVRKTLTETNLLNGAIDPDGRISSDRALNNFNEFIAPYEGQVKEALTKEGRSLQLNQLADEAKSFIDNSTLSDRQKVELQKEIANNLEAFKQFRGRAVPVSAVHDTKVVLANANNYLNPGKDIVDKEAARFFKDIVEKNTSSMDVKKYNGELAKFYTVREAIEAMDRAVVSGGRMGKYFSSLIGSGVGGLVGGPVGAIVGAEVGAKARGGLMARAFGGDVKRGLEATPELLDAMKPTAVGKAAIPDVVIGGKKPVIPDMSLMPDKSVPRAATGDLPVVSAKTPTAPAKKAPAVPKWTYEPIKDATADDFFTKKGLMDSFKDQGGFAKNPLGGEETSLQKVARIRESSAKINRLNPKALDAIEQYVDFQAGTFSPDLNEPVLRENIDLIAKELGFTEQGPKLADRFREVLDARMDSTTRKAKMLPVKEVGGVTTDLVQEAKKYKSAEEFVKAQGTSVYHGTTKESASKIAKGGFKEGKYASELGKGVYVTSDRTPAALFGNKGEVIEAYVPNIKTYELPDFKINPQTESTKIATAIIERDTLPLTLKGMTVDELAERIRNVWDTDNARFWLEKAGYDGITDTTSQIKGQTVLFDPSKIKTRSQLEDIWKQTNKSTLPDSIAIKKADIAEVKEMGSLLTKQEVSKLKKVLERAGYDYNQMKKDGFSDAQILKALET